jgi:hypothetical protein
MNPIRWRTPHLFIALYVFASALASGLEPLPSDLAPADQTAPQRSAATFYSVQRPWLPPLPFNWLAGETNVPLYVSPSRGTNVFFVDDLEVDYVQRSAEAEAERMLMSALDGPPPLPDEPGSGGGSGGGTNSFACPYGTNDFWLEATLTNTTLSLLVHTTNTTSNFDIFWTPSVPVSNGWWWIARGLPGQLSFPIPGTNLFGGMGFFAAGTTNGLDAQGITDACRALVGQSRILTNDVDQDCLPDLWEIRHFGDLTQSADGDYDGDGVVNGDECALGKDPNKVIFYPNFAKYHINSTEAHGTFRVSSGTPAFMAILIDSEDFGSAQWQPYTPEFTVPLGPTNGVYQVWIALRGRSPDSRQNWTWNPLTRDLEPPQIEITQPTNNITAQPLIDLRGYSPEPLSTLYYSVSNAAGLRANVSGFVSEQYLDPNLHKFTTNWFFCADLELTNGVNIVTLLATDLAGNLSTNVFSYTLDFSVGTNPPLLALYWPQDAEEICGDRFTLRGRLDDPTATVVAQITDAAGNVNGGKSIVERNGLVWVENLPLAPGTNLVVLTMTNAAGYPSQTNFTVIRSDDLNLTIDDVPNDQLSTGLVTVSGTIDSADYTVWVNGIRATNLTDNGNGTWRWEAESVPLNSGGTATIQACAIPNSVDGGQGASMETPIDNAVPGNPRAPGRRARETDPEQDARVINQRYESTYKDTWRWTGLYGGWQEGYHCNNIHWTNLLALPRQAPSAAGFQIGTRVEDWVIDGADPWEDSYSYWSAWDEQDFISTSGSMQAHVILAASPQGSAASNFWLHIALPTNLEVWEEHTPYWSLWYVNGSGDGLKEGYIDRTERMEVKLRTGGKRLSNRKNFFQVWGTATNYPSMDRDGNWIPQTAEPGAIQVLGKPLVADNYPDGRTYKALPDNQEYDLTPAVSCPRYTFKVFAKKHKLVLDHDCPINGDTSRTDLGVGERVTLKFEPPLDRPNIWINAWSTTAGSVSPGSGTQTSFTAPSNAIPAKVTATLRGEQLDMGFKVFEPTGKVLAKVRSADSWNGILPAAFAGMSLRVVMAPTNISLYRVQVMEVPAGPTNVQGYFTIHGAPDHDAQHRAGQWYQLGCDNAWPADDHASSDVYSQPWSGAGWSGGSFTWRIPVKWKIDEGQEHLLDPWDQRHDLLADGTVTITKFDHYVTRHANERSGTPH